MSSRLQTMLLNLRHRYSLPLKMHAILSILATVFSLRNLLVLFCILNIKNLPLVWELRLIYRSWTAWHSKQDVISLLKNGAVSNKVGLRPSISTHPLFAPVSITTASPLLEIDHNLHKSNSTYFSDLDESRTKLMVHLLSSTKFSPAELEREGYKGNFAVILGSVHASFLKEIKPYEVYEVRSRVLGWDAKWILIGSVFVRTKTAKDKRADHREVQKRVERSGVSVEEARTQIGFDTKEVLYAACLSKYVVKKGRFTVPPERSWRSAGWLPERPTGMSSPVVTSGSSVVPTPDNEAVGEVKISESDL